MTLLAAVASGVAVYLAGRALAGAPVRPPLPRRGAGRAGSSALWLRQAGLRVSPPRFWAGAGALGVAGFGLALLVTGTPAASVAPGCLAAFAPRLWVSRLRARRLRDVAACWPDAIRDLVAGISAGMSLTQALGALAETGPEPLRHAFARFPVLARILGVVPALEAVKAELADPISDRVVEVLIFAHDRGGRAVVEVLRDLAEATAADVAAAEEIATDALEQKLNARAVLVLPWLVLLALVASPGPFRDFYQSPPGALTVAVAGAMSACGALLVGRLARDPVEPRVLAGDAEARS